MSESSRETLRPSPAKSEGLRRDSYELRAHDGSFIAIVRRETAQAAIIAGEIELRVGRHGAFLRPVHRAKDLDRNPNAGNSRTWLGPRSPEDGPLSGYRPNEKVCNEWPHLSGVKK